MGPTRRGYALLLLLMLMAFAGAFQLRRPRNVPDLPGLRFRVTVSTESWERPRCPGDLPCKFQDAVGRLGRDQRVTIDLNTRTSLRSIVVLPDGAILLRGDFGILKLRPDGAIDRRFGRRGIADLQPGGPSALAVDRRGRIVAATYREIGPEPAQPWMLHNGAFAVARFHPNGKPDRSFGRRGEVVVDASPEQDGPEHVWVDERGRIIVAGDASNGHALPVIVRLSPSGRLDPTFGTRGIARVDVKYPTIVREETGRFMIAGWPLDDPSPADGPTEIVRLLADGTLDRSFGNAGRVTDPDGVTVLAVAGDGAVLGARSHWVGPTYHSTQYSLVRVDAAGTIVAIAGGFREASRLLVDGTGRLVTQEWDRFGTYVRRHLPSGQDDASFAGGGRAAFDNNWQDDVTIALTPDDRVIVAGVEDVDTGAGEDERRLWIQRLG